MVIRRVPFHYFIRWSRPCKYSICFTGCFSIYQFPTGTQSSYYDNHIIRYVISRRYEAERRDNSTSGNARPRRPPSLDRVGGVGAFGSQLVQLGSGQHRHIKGTWSRCAQPSTMKWTRPTISALNFSVVGQTQHVRVLCIMCISCLQFVD